MKERRDAAARGDADGGPEDVEELRFADDVRAPRPRRRRMGAVATAVVTILATLLALGCAGGAWWMWRTRWREVEIVVDGTAHRTRADTTVARFLEEHDGFGRRPGRLVSLKGDVLEADGGEPASVSVDGEPVDPADYGARTLADAATMTVTPGEDRVEGHTVERRTVPYGTDIDLDQGPIQVVTQQGRDGVDEVWVGRRSGQEVVNHAIEPMRKLTVRSFAPSPTGRKVIALTFDDGPTQYTGRILDVLKSRNVKATFFDLGQQALEMPELERRMVREGHQVASHSVSHPYLPGLDRGRLRAELDEGFADLEKASDTRTRVLRAPYGAFGVQQWKDAADVVDMNVLWTIDTLDWKRPGKKAIHDEVMRTAYDGAIALMHDGGGDRTQTVEALPGIIDDLRGQGYSFVTVDELCEMGGVPKPAH